MEQGAVSGSAGLSRSRPMHVVSRSPESLPAEYCFSLEMRVLEWIITVLDLVIGVNRLERGGSLFEGIV
mgnify:CR=1 FL=1